MGARKRGTQPDKGRKEAESFAPRTAAGQGGDMDIRIKDARAALHGAIQRAGDKPLSECPEVLRLSRELDDLIDEMHRRGRKE